VGQVFLIIEASHSDTPRSLDLLWTSNQPETETSTWQHTTLKRDRRPFRQRDSNPQSQQALERTATGIDLSNVLNYEVHKLITDEKSYCHTTNNPRR
jgi:hypothetical protein